MELKLSIKGGVHRPRLSSLNRSLCRPRSLARSTHECVTKSEIRCSLFQSCDPTDADATVAPKGVAAHVWRVYGGYVDFPAKAVILGVEMEWELDEKDTPYIGHTGIRYTKRLRTTIG